MRAAACVLALVAACSIEHPSDELACDGPADCTGARDCVDGYCVEPAAAQCPTACTTCDPGARQCAIDRRTGGGTGRVSCPAGWSCLVTCGADACRDVDCGGATACQVTCTGANACENVTCGDGACDVTCTGDTACRQVDCRDACACDVTCADAQSCDMASRCPASTCEDGDGCTSAAASCDSC